MADHERSIVKPRPNDHRDSLFPRNDGEVREETALRSDNPRDKSEGINEVRGEQVDIQNRLCSGRSRCW